MKNVNKQLPYFNLATKLNPTLKVTCLLCSASVDARKVNVKRITVNAIKLERSVLVLVIVLIVIMSSNVAQKS